MQTPVTKRKQEEEDRIPTPTRSQDCPILLNFYDTEISKARFLCSKQNKVCDENRDSWWLLCELTLQQRVAFDQEKLVITETRKTCVCVHAHECACAHTYIFM